MKLTRWSKKIGVSLSDKSTSKKRTFLDTNVLISAFCGEHELAARCFDVIGDPDREFIASDFLKLELLPKPAFNKQEEALAFYNSYLSGVSEMLLTTPEMTASASNLACQYGLGPIDAIHYQTAIEANASEFITIEKPTKAFFQINNPSIKVISLR